MRGSVCSVLKLERHGGRREPRFGCGYAARCYYQLGKAKSSMARRQSTFRKQRLSAEYGYTVIYERLLEGGYQVIVPALPGIVTYGRTLEEAREMAEDAIRCHLRALLKDGEDIRSTSSRASSAKQV